MTAVAALAVIVGEKVDEPFSPASPQPERNFTVHASAPKLCRHRTELLRQS